MELGGWLEQFYFFSYQTLTCPSTLTWEHAGRYLVILRMRHDLPQLTATSIFGLITTTWAFFMGMLYMQPILDYAF